MPKSMAFVLVRWLDDESVGVMPISAVKTNANNSVYVGAFVEVKWGRGYAEILKLSGKCQIVQHAVQLYC